MVDMHRRITDDTTEHQAEIEQLIAGEQDKKVRLQLIVLNRMNNLLIANTQNTKALGDEVEKIVEKLEAIAIEQNNYRNQRKVATFLFTRVIPILQLVVVGAVAFVMNDLKNLHATDMTIIAEQARREPMISDLRDFKKRVETYMEENK